MKQERPAEPEAQTKSKAQAQPKVDAAAKRNPTSKSRRAPKHKSPMKNPLDMWFVVTSAGVLHSRHDGQSQVIIKVDGNFFMETKAHDVAVGSRQWAPFGSVIPGGSFVEVERTGGPAAGISTARAWGYLEGE